MKKYNTSQDTRKIFFSADFHIYHNREFVYKPRGFNNTQDHNDYILKEINAYISENDHFYVLGDFALNSTPEQVKEFLSRINCQNIFYIWGNHESSTRKIYEEAKRAIYPEIDAEIYPITYKNITFLGHYYEISINKQPIILQHFAPLVWNHSHHGSWSCIGHSHGSCKEILPECKNGKILDVGVDVAMKTVERPFFNLDEIKKIMDTKHIKICDHHNQQTT